MSYPSEKSGVTILGRGRESGFLIAEEEGYRWYVTDCCECAVSISIDDGETYCKGCYAAVDPFLGDVVRDSDLPL
jgi:hypothetical protein